jgi:quinol monooxygenase YgiN
MIGEWESLAEAEAYLRSPEHDALVVKYAPFIQGPLQRFTGELIE